MREPQRRYSPVTILSSKLAPAYVWMQVTQVKVGFTVTNRLPMDACDKSSVGSGQRLRSLLPSLGGRACAKFVIPVAMRQSSARQTGTGSQPQQLRPKRAPTPLGVWLTTIQATTSSATEKPRMPRPCVRGSLRPTHWSAHHLRSTGRTMLAEVGCPEEVGEAIMGRLTAGVSGV